MPALAHSGTIRLINLGFLRIFGFGKASPSVAHGAHAEVAGDEAGRTRTPADPFEGGEQLTPTDADADITVEYRALWIGTGGTIRVVVWGKDLTRKTINTTVNTGSVFPYRVLRVLQAGTTATGIATGH
ncbi:MAG: hypothetical protein ABI134_13530 [Byssovorax sp.]